ncbi:SPOR domain-containing protein [Melioribacter sp. Ez-97]|uniref:SPOR domain-containing protein n=1 Tax=Melioribacter sp. Ez-97 TaxID=3423434 RepID=UPI003EDA2392
MNIDELKKKVSGSLGVSSSEAELAFGIFVKKLADQLAPGLTIKVPGVGFFQLKKNNEENKSDEILFSPLRESLSDKVTFISIDMPVHFYEEPSEDTETFSIGVGKPIIPIGEEAEQDAEASYVVFKKLIEERTNDLLSESERIPDANIWDEYYKSEKSGTKQDIKTELSELTADLHFDEDRVSEDIINNIIDDRDKNDEKTEEDDLTPSQLLEDYESFEDAETTLPTENNQDKEEDFGLEYLLENLESDSANENVDNDDISEREEVKEIEKEEEAHEEAADKVDGDVIPDESVDGVPEEQAQEENAEEEILEEEITDEMQEEEETSISESEYEPDDKKEVDETKEIEIELGKHRKKDQEYVEERIDVEDTDEPVDADIEDEEEDEFLGLGKKIEGNTEWNWGDELKEELENYDDSEFEEEIEDVHEEEDILKSPRRVSENLFEKLETTIKEELKEERISTKYEFVEQKEERRPVTSAQQNKYEDEQEYEEEKTGYLKYVIIGLFVAIMFAGVIYLFFNGGNKSEPEIAERQNAAAVQEQGNNEIASLSQDQNESINENIPPVIEDDFPRVAKLEDKTNIQAAPAPRQSVDNAGLYINPANDIHVYKTIFTDGSRYYVQTSSWRNEAKAINEVSNWKRKGHKAYIMKVNIPEKGGIWFRVRVGPFNSESEARKFYEQNF